MDEAGAPGASEPQEVSEVVAGQAITAQQAVAAAAETPQPPRPATEPGPPPRPPLGGVLGGTPVPTVPPAPQLHELSRIAQDLQIRRTQVEAVHKLLREQYAPPYIARYCEELTGGLSEEVIRRIRQRIQQCRELASRKQTMLRSLARQGRLTPELADAILHAESSRRLDDLYLPFRLKKKSPASDARDKGLGEVAAAIWSKDPAVSQLDEVLPGLVNPDKWLLTTEDVLNGIKAILTETIAEQAGVRAAVRSFMWDTGYLAAQRLENVPDAKAKEFQSYFQFREPLRHIPPHRILAIHRGVKLRVLRAYVDVDRSRAIELTLQQLPLQDHPHRDLLMSLVPAAVEQVLLPSLNSEIRQELTEHAQQEVVAVFARNLRSLLLQPPLRHKRVLAIDPGSRVGMTVAALDADGRFLESDVIHLQTHGKSRDQTDAKRRLERLIRKHQLQVVAIGNTRGCQAVEQLVASLIEELERGGGRSMPPAATAPPPLTAPATASYVVPPPSAQTVATPPPEIVATLPAAEAAATIVVPPPVPPITPEVFTATSVTSESAAVVPAPDAAVIARGEVAPDTAGHPPEPPLIAAVPLPAAAVPAPATLPPAATGETTPPPTLAPSASLPSAPTAAADLDGLPPAPPDLAFTLVMETGVREYATGPVGQEEFPQLDPAVRAAISIGRRLLDPLAELVKVEPQDLGASLQQHDVKADTLKEVLGEVVESCVNEVGADLNRAEVPLLRYICGLNLVTAREIVNWRQEHGPFRSRQQLREVPGIGDKQFVQAAGFLYVRGGEEPLDAVSVHPQQYELARQVLQECGLTAADLTQPQRRAELAARASQLPLAEWARQWHVPEVVVRDVVQALAHAASDPRDSHPAPTLKRALLKLEDIRPGMQLTGTVVNVVPFGAFVDIGLRESGLVHISHLANRFVRNPHEVVSVGDTVTVWVLEVKKEQRRISLSMIPPGEPRRTELAGTEPVARRGEPSRRRGETTRSDETPPGPAQPGPSSPAPSGPRQSRSDRRPPKGRRPGGAPLQSDQPPTSSGRGPEPRNRRHRRGAADDSPPAPPVSPQPEGTQEVATSPAAESPPPASPETPPVPPKPAGRGRPHRPPRPLPVLPPEKRSGKAALNTFAELAAFFKQREEAAPPAPEAGTSPPAAENTSSDPNPPQTSA